LVYLYFLHGVDKNYKIKDPHWLDTKIDEWRPREFHPMMFGVDTQIFIGMGELAEDGRHLSSYAMSTNLLNVFDDLDLDLIRVGVLDDAWRLKKEREIELSDQIIRRIRKSGKELVLADTQHSPYLLEHKVSWREFRKIHLRRIEFFTRRYHPDYYCVVTEPSVYHDFGVQGPMDVEKWLQETEAAVDLVKRLDPSVRTLVSVLPEGVKDRAYIKRLFSIRNLDIVGLEAYYPKNIREIEKILKALPGRRGKKIWMTETWSGTPFPYTKIRDKDQEDAKWIQAMTYFAQRNEFSALLLWPFQYFVTYERYDSSQEGIDYSRRTTSFYSYKNRIQEIREKSAGKAD